MAGEDYQTERDGVQMNISKAIRYDKRKIGYKNFNKLKERFDIEFIEEKNNIIRFKLYGNEYYFGLVKSKLRKKGEKDWTGKLITKLKSDIDEMYKNIDL